MPSECYVLFLPKLELHFELNVDEQFRRPKAAGDAACRSDLAKTLRIPEVHFCIREPAERNLERVVYINAQRAAGALPERKGLCRRYLVPQHTRLADDVATSLTRRKRGRVGESVQIYPRIEARHRVPARSMTIERN